MRRLIPDTISGRTLLVLIVGLTLSHGLSMALYFTDRANAVMHAGGEHVGERIVTIGRLVESAPPGERARIVALADDPTLRVSRDTQGVVADSPDDGWQTEILRESLTVHLAKLGNRTFRIHYGDAAPGAPKTILVALKLADESWLNFVAPVAAPGSFLSFRVALSLAVMVIAIVVFSAAVVHFLIEPLRLFSRAAQRLGIDINAPPLPVSGPREVRQAAGAFNDMQSRIRRLVEDRTRMLAAVSHDLRTPITLLRLRAEFIEEDDEQKKTMATLDEMEAMIASILAFARDEAETEQRRIVDLSALLGSICDDMADVGLPVDFDAVEKLTCECRPTALRRALRNLIENAVKYGGNARVSLIGAATHIVVGVEDDGPGIAPDEFETVFEPFYRIEGSRSRETGGMGLGLSVAKSIVNFHGGEVRLSNHPGGGLRVDVSLPRRQGAQT